MTDSDIITTAAADPVVFEARSVQRVVDNKLVRVTPTAQELQAAATTELYAEIQSLLAEEDIARGLLETETPLTLNSGGTDVQQGTWFVIPEDVGLIQDITVGDSRKQVNLFTSRSAFNHWWDNYYETSNTSGETEAIVPWNPSGKKPTLLFSPGVGSDTTAYILHYKDVKTFTVALFHQRDHYLILEGVKNRLSGGRFEVSYQDLKRKLKQRVASMVHRPTPMRRDPRLEKLAWTLNRMYGGPSDSPPYWRHRIT